MKWVERNRGNVIITVLAVMLGILGGLFLSNSFYAEAVIGGMGNVTQTNNPHNFSASSSGVKAQSETQVCVFCHTPHNAYKEVVGDNILNAPLWNHKLSTQAYKVNTPDFITFLSTPLQSPDGASKLCLSCHDGTVAIGATYSRGSITMAATANLTAGFMLSPSSPAYIGNDLTTKHLVSVPMNDKLITDSIVDCESGFRLRLQYPWATGNANIVLRPTKATYPTSSSGGIEGGYAASASGSNKYKAGYNYGVQCSTCHDPHLWANTTDKETPGAFFIVSGFTSLCSACHVGCN
ncbi:MAG: hypothetical protein Q8J64_00775 [Thermodesulfovibrionales bacterium]|nr:hypothetical protein [Thermodesulfovibrionales bacterium]